MNQEITNDTYKIITTSLTFVAGLAWNSAFESLFQSISWLQTAGPWVYAVCITAFTVFAIYITKKRLIRKITPKIKPPTKKTHK